MLSPTVVFEGISADQTPNMAPHLTETLYEAEGNGWTAQGLRDYLKANIPTSAGAGAVVWHLRQAARNEPTKPQETKTRKDQHLSHQPCPDGHTGCQLCWCQVCKPTCALPHQHNRTPTHHRGVPIPSDLAKELRAIIARTRVPK